MVLTLTILFSAIALIAGNFTNANAQDLHVKMSASKEVVGPGDYTTYVIVVSNIGSTDLLNVSASIVLPDQIKGFTTPPNLSCYYAGHCYANETATWDIGTLAAGQSNITFYRTKIDDNATDTTITTDVTVSASNSSDAHTTHKITIDPTPLLQMILTSTSGPISPGRRITYNLKYGNIGSTSPSNVTIRMPVPDGTTFTSATDNGMVENDTVVWNLGLLGAGGGGTVRMVTTANNNLENGQIIRATVSIDPNESNEYVVKSSSLLPVHSDLPLKLEYGVSQTVVGPDEQVTYTLTATNTGSTDLLDLSARVLFPGDVTNFATPVDFDCYYAGHCFASENGTWNIGTLAPGQSRTVFFRTSLANSIPYGEVLHSILTAKGSNTQQILATQDVSVDPTPLMQLSISPDAGPIVVGKPFNYTITFSNAGSSSPSNVKLYMSVPEGTNLVSASGGASMSNGIISWDIGLMGTGASKTARVTILPNANLSEGTIVKAEAWIDPGINTEYIVHSTTANTVHVQQPLHMEYGISQSAVEPGGNIYYSLTATNSGTVDLLDLKANVLLPNDIKNFAPLSALKCYYANACQANERAKWDIGTLTPGQSKTVFFQTALVNNAPKGDIFKSILTASGSNTNQIVASMDASVDPTPLLRMNLTTGPSPVAPGDRFPYTVTFGNIGSQSPSGAKLHVWIPEGAVFDSASHGGIEKNGVVTWNIKSLAVGNGGQVKVWVKPNQQLANGSILKARAEIDPNISTEIVLHSKAITTVQSGEPLDINYSVNQSNGTPGNTLTYTIKAKNNGNTDLLDLAVRVLLPSGINNFAPPADFNCYYANACQPNEIATWDVGTLTPGQSQSVSFSVKISNGTSLGNVLQSYALATESNADDSEHLIQQDILVGSLIAFNLPPSAAVIASPEDSTSLVIGGADGSAPLPPDTPFIVRWMPSTDPENDAVTYHWQLSSSTDFSNPLIDEMSGDSGKDTLYQTDYGTISNILEITAWQLEIPSCFIIAS